MKKDPDIARRATLIDVARVAGVSRATASLVVRKSPLVGPQTRARVEDAMRTLGYVYNVGAARLRRGRSRTVGVMLPNLSNPFFGEMLAGIETVLDAEAMAVMVANTRESLSKQDAFFRRMREHDVDGIIVCAVTETPESLLDDARAWGIPTVQALRWISLEAADYAGTDYADGMRQAVRHLADLGHRRITFVAGNRRHSAYRDRLAGLRESAGSDMDILTLETPLTHAHGRALSDLLVDRPDPPTAIICFNDVVALGLLKGFAERGVKVGSDVSLIGFDDVPEAALASPALTSVATEPLAIGASAARLLLDRLADEHAPVRSVIEAARLVERESTGYPITHDPSGSVRLTTRSAHF